MKTYALVSNGLVLSHFTTDRPTSDFPDIAASLVEAPSDVIDGWYFDGSSFSPVAENVPESVTMRQARLALLGAGLLNAVSNAIAAMPSPQKEEAQIEWEYSGEVLRHKELVKALGPALGLTDAQIDALFVAASKL